MPHGPRRLESMPFLTLDNFLASFSRKNKKGCVCLVATASKVLFHQSYGYAQLIPRSVRARRNTVFDLASLTKPLVTALSIMYVISRKKCRLEDRISRFLPAFKGTVNGGKTIKELLLHTAGLPAWYPLYLFAPQQRSAYLQNVNTRNAGVLYSCLGYIILGQIVEKITQQNLASFAKRIFRKAGVKHVTFCPSCISSIAATERGNIYERKTAAAHGDVTRVPWREYVIRGEVHDGNAFYAYNGIAGNAGLFGNTGDVLTVLRHYLAGEIIPLRSVRMMITDHTGGVEKRGLGWVMDPYPGILSAHAFSHTGFTGTMCCVDPVHDITILLFTNAVHPRVNVNLMKPVRKHVVKLISRLWQRA